MPKQFNNKEKHLEKPFYDLYLNRSSLNIYVQNYYDAWEDLKKAQVLDPSKKLHEIQKIEDMNDKVFNLIASKANIKPKYLEQFFAQSKDMTVKRDQVEMKPLLFSELKEGKYHSNCVAGRIVKIISEKQSNVRYFNESVLDHGQRKQLLLDIVIQFFE